MLINDAVNFFYTLKKYKDVNPDIKVGHAMHDDFIQTMNRICTPMEDAGIKRIVKQVGKNVAMNASIANGNDGDGNFDDVVWIKTFIVYSIV